LAFLPGSIVTAEDYNLLATLTDKVYYDISTDSEFHVNISDGLPDNASTTNLIFFIHETDVRYRYNSPGRGPFFLTPSPDLGDFIIVQIGKNVITSGFSVNTANGTITFTSDLPAATTIMVFNRSRHKFGWGNSETPKKEIRDTILTQDINAIIDRTNIMLARDDSPSELSNLEVGERVNAENYTILDAIIQEEIIDTGAHIKTSPLSDLSTELTFTRLEPWSTVLQGSASYTFADYNSARYFFNAGGSLRVKINVEGDPNNSGVAIWKYVTGSMGSLIFNWNNTTQNGFGGVSNQKGFYHLTDDWQTIFRNGGSGAGDYGSYGSYGSYGGYYGEYSSLAAVFDAKYSYTQDNRFSVDIRVTMEDGEYNFTPIVGSTDFIAIVNNPANVERGDTTFTMQKPIVRVLDHFDVNSS
jgi:hypothetical protein